MSAFGGKADIDECDIEKCPLMTQSGHAPFQRCSLIRYDGLS